MEKVCRDTLDIRRNLWYLTLKNLVLAREKGEIKYIIMKVLAHDNHVTIITCTIVDIFFNFWVFKEFSILF